MKKIIFIVSMFLLAVLTNNIYALESDDSSFRNLDIENTGYRVSSGIVQNKIINVKCEGDNIFTGQYCIIRVAYEVRLNNSNNVISTRVLSCGIIYSSMPEEPGIAGCDIFNQDNSLFIRLELDWIGNEFVQNNHYIFNLPMN